VAFISPRSPLCVPFQSHCTIITFFDEKTRSAQVFTSGYAVNIPAVCFSISSRPFTSSHPLGERCDIDASVA
jgi:hypothetical protein